MPPIPLLPPEYLESLPAPNTPPDAPKWLLQPLGAPMLPDTPSGLST